MELGLKKKRGIVQRGSDKGSSVLLQRRVEGGTKSKETQRHEHRWVGGCGVWGVVVQGRQASLERCEKR